MKMKTAGFTLSALFLGAVMGVVTLKQEQKEVKASHRQFMDCFEEAHTAYHPTWATPEERAQAQKKAEDITKTAHALAGIQLNDEQIQTASAHLMNSQLILGHCAAKTGVQVEGRWTSGVLPPPLK